MSRFCTIALGTAYCFIFPGFVYASDVRIVPTEQEVRDLTGVVWGKKVRGLQLGVRLEGKKHPFKMGERLDFNVFIRNHSKKPITLLYPALHFDDTPVGFDIENSNGTPMSSEQFWARQPVPSGEYGFEPLSNAYLWATKRVLKPKTVAFLGATDLGVDNKGPNVSSIGSDWTPHLWAPGKYKLTCVFCFEKRLYERIEPKSNIFQFLGDEHWEGTLTATGIEVETVVADKPTTTP